MWLWCGVGGMGRTPESSWGWGRWQKGGGGLFLAGCAQIVPHPSLRSTWAVSKHLSLFWGKQSLPRSYAINFIEYVSRLECKHLLYSFHPPLIQPASQPSPTHSLTHPIISDPPRRQTPPLLLFPGGPRA